MRLARTIVTAVTTASLLALLPVLASAAPPTGHPGAMGQKMMGPHSRYGGPTYTGKPALNVTASLVQAGGGPAHYSTAKALTSMVGSKMVNAEVGKLTKQYGKAKVSSWLTVFDFAVDDSLRIATKAGVKLPHGTLSGKKLAATLVQAGLDKTGTFYVEYMLDKAVSHKIHEQVMDDIDAKYGATADANYHAVTNQAMFDLAHALGAKSVKLASFH